VLSRIVIGGLLLAGFSPGCGRKDAGPPEASELVAQVGDATLSRLEVAKLVPKGSSPADSAALVSRYLEAWVKQRLKLEQAREQVQTDPADIEKRVEEYREALLLHEFEKQYVGQHLDTKIRAAESQGLPAV